MPPADPRTDQELVEAGNRGDETALAALYLRHREWAAALALRFTGNRDEALDVMQEAFVYLFGKFPGLVLRARVTTLLYPAVKNIALARKRKRRGGGGGAAGPGGKNHGRGGKGEGGGGGGGGGGGVGRAARVSRRLVTRGTRGRGLGGPGGGGGGVAGWAAGGAADAGGGRDGGGGDR